MNSPTYDDINEALRATVAGLGGFKTVGATLRPEIPADAAGRWLSDCFNDDRREKLTVEQLCLIRRLARRGQVHILAEFEMKDAGYSPPVPIEPAQERAALKRDILTLLSSVNARLERLEETEGEL